MIFIDTNFLIALMNPRDSLHARARAWAATISEPLLVSEYVIWETVNGFSDVPDRPKAHRAVAWIESSGNCEVVAASAELFQAGLRRHAERPDKAWSLTDCISFIVIEQRGVIRALTHDHHFEQAGFEALLRRDPP